MKKEYHSALHDELPVASELEHYKAGGSVVFRHDITTVRHTLYQCQQIDVIYSEPAWRDGYALFCVRAGENDNAEHNGYLDYLTAIHDTISQLKQPTYIVMGKHMFKHLQPEATQPVLLYGYPALLGVWNAPLLPQVATNDDIIQHITETYSCALDFSCGYGNLARAMLANSKKFVCSDINGRCIYYIATTLMGYTHAR